MIKYALKKDTGFTLVELAIAMMIIGLLIAGVLKGQELIENSRSVQYVRQLKAYNTAVMAFRSIYRQWPGDMKRPGQRLPDCILAVCTTAGDANGYIGPSFSGVYSAPRIRPAEAMATGEQRRFWVHLTRAGLITGVDPDYSDPTYSAQPGVELPAAPTTGVIIGITSYSATTWGAPIPQANFYIIRTATPGGPPSGANTYSITGPRAYYIDQKTDDGLPGSGNTRLGINTDNGVIPANCVTANTYNLTSDVINCNLIVKIN